MALLLGTYRDVSTDQSVARCVDDREENQKGFLDGGSLSDSKQDRENT